MRSQSLAGLGAMAVVLASLSVPSGTAVAEPGRIQRFSQVTQVQRISRDLIHGRKPSEDDTEVEPSLALDPLNALHQVAAFQDGRYPDGAAAAAGFATTFDGRSWITGVLPGVTRITGGVFERSGDQVVTFGPDGSVYAVMTGFDGQFMPERHTAILVLRSDDGGIRWNDPVIVREDRDFDVFHDNPSIAVDSDPSSSHFGRIYVTWVREHLIPRFTSPIVISSSDDRGVTWSPFVNVSDKRSNGEGAHPMIASDGAVTVTWQPLLGEASRVAARTSTDGGQTFGPTVNIADDEWKESPGMRSGFGLPSSAIDPVTGEMYVVWQDTRFRNDGLNDALISFSTDGGATWTSPARVNQDPLNSQLDHLTPVTAARDGVVAVCYRTRLVSGSRGSIHVDMRCIHSEDGGISFENELPLGPVTDVRYAAKVYPFGGHWTAFLGDYMGVAVSGGTILASWARSSLEGKPGGQHQTIWA
ncbi:MAG TPA: sialidase family protein, partial [Actinomycetota bacterium]